jgi:DNA repair exonuclease SbcCD nuclease subunit
MVIRGVSMNINFIHTSDIHLGKKFDIKNFSLKEREKRRQEIWDTFDEIIRLARIEKMKYLFIAGDLTEREYLNFKSLKNIALKFKSIPDTRIIIACGSNDPYNINSMYEYIDWPQNVYIIKSTDSVEKLNFQDDNICISAMSWDSHEFNKKTQAIYDISIDESKINVLLLYCDVNSESTMLPVNIDIIKNKFDYCALGGRHNYESPTNNSAYSGSPEPLSFKEIGEHGIIMGQLEKKNTIYKFQAMSKRKFVTRHINMEIDHSFNKILDLIKFSGDTFSNIKDYVRINLTGTVNTDVSMDEVENEAKQFFYYIEFEEDYVYKNSEDKLYDHNEFNIIESYKLQFENHQDKLEQQAFKLGLEVLRKEKVVK